MYLDIETTHNATKLNKVALSRVVLNRNCINRVVDKCTRQDV